MDSGGVLKIAPQAESAGAFSSFVFGAHASRVRHGLLVLPSSYTRSWLAGAGDLGSEPERPLSYPQRVRRRTCIARPTRLPREPSEERRQAAPSHLPPPKPAQAPYSLRRVPLLLCSRAYPSRVAAIQRALLEPAAHQKDLVVASAPRQAIECLLKFALRGHSKS